MVDEVVAGYRQAGITMFLLQAQPLCRPAAYEGWLRDRGLDPFDAQDRIVRDASPLALAPPPRSERTLRSSG